MISDRALTKRQKKLAERANNRSNFSGNKQAAGSATIQNFTLSYIRPITENQSSTFDLYEDGYNLLLHGSPGTGKTFLALYLAFREILSGKSDLKKVVIIRSAQTSKGIGFLPGDEKEKMAVYEAPYVEICNKLFNRADAYSILKQKGFIEFHSTSFLRGTTIEDSAIIFDEIQNSAWNEIKVVLTRVGDNSKVICCGDLHQDDLTSTRYSEKSGLPHLLKIFSAMDSVRQVEFGIDDIVRSGFVKELIIAESKMSRLN